MAAGINRNGDKNRQIGRAGGQNRRACVRKGSLGFDDQKINARFLQRTDLFPVNIVNIVKITFSVRGNKQSGGGKIAPNQYSMGLCNALRKRHQLAVEFHCFFQKAVIGQCCTVCPESGRVKRPYPGGDIVALQL